MAQQPRRTIPVVEVRQPIPRRTGGRRMSEQWIETCRCGASIKLTGWMYSNTEKAALEWRKNHRCKTHTSRRLAMTNNYRDTLKGREQALYDDLQAVLRAHGYRSQEGDE